MVVAYGRRLNNPLLLDHLISRYMTCMNVAESASASQQELRSEASVSQVISMDLMQDPVPEKIIYNTHRGDVLMARGITHL